MTKISRKKSEDIMNECITKVYLMVICALLLTIILSCTPTGQQHRSEQRISRLISKNPQLVKSDTIVKDTIVHPNEVIAHSIIDLDTNKSHNKIDSVADRFIDNTQIKDSVEKGMKNVSDHAGDIDTTVNRGESKIHINKTGNKLTVDVDTKPDSIIIKQSTIVNTVKPVPVLSWYQKLLLKIGTIGMCFILLILLYVVYRILKATLKF